MIKKYIVESDNGTKNMKTIKSFFGTKLIDIEDSIIIDNKSIRYSDISGYQYFNIEYLGATENEQLIDLTDLSRITWFASPRGIINNFIPISEAALAFGKTPPTIPTEPSELIVPVIATPFGITLSESTEYIRRVIAAPADGPSTSEAFALISKIKLLFFPLTSDFC